MKSLLLDVIPIDEERYREMVRQAERQLADSVDTVSGVVEPVVENPPTGGGNGTLWAIIGGIAAALIGLAFIIFMVRACRRREDQQLSCSRV